MMIMFLCLKAGLTFLYPYLRRVNILNINIGLKNKHYNVYMFGIMWRLLMAPPLMSSYIGYNYYVIHYVIYNINKNLRLT